MKLKYKISLSIFTVSLVIVTAVSYFYSKWSYENIMDTQKKVLQTAAEESARNIEHELEDKLANTLTISSAPIVVSSLEDSNAEFINLSDEHRDKKIDALNEKWMDAEDETDSFVKPYLSNELALFLKKQQTILEGVYGEIFITNRYGAMIASTAKLTTLSHAKKYWWKKSFNMGDGAVFFDDRGFDASVGGYVIGITVPVKQDGEIIGILKANINIMQALDGIVTNYNKMNYGVLKVVRTKGCVVYEKGLPPLSTEVNPLILDNLRDLESGVRTVKEYAKDNLVAYAPLRLTLDNKNIGFGGKIKTGDSSKGNDRELWHVVISYPKELALSQSTQTNQMIIYIGFLIAVLSALVAFFIGRWISKPIEDLQIVQLQLQEQEEIMIAQSRHAAMGEMISMIAHQWRQPISVIAMGANNILADIELEMVDNKNLKETSVDILQKTQELSKTIDDFKGFFKPQKQVDDVFVEDILNNACDVIGKSLQNSNIELIKDIKSTIKVKTYSRELMQVFINILKNAKEALVENNIEQKEIKISIRELENSVLIKICDNGNGIKTDIIDKIFNPYFSTKDEKNGTGLGLYMSKTIVQKHLNGTIEVENIDDGVCFEIRLPLRVCGDIDE